ncbi:hypothetical protein [Haloplanus salinarum]|uniref:hypothetical protein n=1 Tax=Haloplanus salinarum TaxID=1912324 RepID=UPI00214B4EDA|nr:hypothetical protein [Haloplanus salinarum]
MPEVPIPFTDQEVDTDDDASSIVMTLVVVAVGFAAFVWLRDVGGYLAQQANSTITNLVGIDPTSGDSQEDPLF